MPLPQKDFTSETSGAESVSRNSEAGYTFLELLVALHLSMILIGIVYLNYQFISKLMNRLEDRLTVDIELENFGYDLTRKLEDIKEFIRADTQNLIFICSDGDTFALHILNKKKNVIGQYCFKYPVTVKFSYYIGFPVEGEWTTTPTFSEIRNIKAIHLLIESQHNNRRYRLEITTRLLKRRVQILTDKK